MFVSDAHAKCNSSASISTHPPLHNNILARGYANFKVKACIKAESYISCLWKYESISHTFYFNGVGCRPSLTSDYMVKCSENNKIITTSMTILTPLTTANNHFILSCTSRSENVLPLTISRNVTVRGKRYITLVYKKF